jgi:hypothetical protein
VSPPPRSLSPDDLPSLGDIFSHQAGIFVSVCRPSWPQMETGLSTVPLPQPHLALVSLDL